MFAYLVMTVVLNLFPPKPVPKHGPPSQSCVQKPGSCK